MKRRDAIKNLGFAAGFAIAAPSFFSLLQSCKSAELPWSTQFFTEDEKAIITNLVDIILPKTEGTPSATELNVPQFIDKYIAEVLDIKNQNLVRNGFSTIKLTLKPNKETNINDISQEEYTALLDTYLLVRGDVDKEREENLESLELTKSEFLNQIKYLTIKAYLTTEEIGENVLKYDPVPTDYYCGDLQELTEGKSWSL